MSEELVAKIREALSSVADPHMGISIVEMGIVGDIEVNEAEKTAKIVIKPTNPGCMSAANIAMQARINAEKLDEIDKAEIVVEGHMMADAICDMVNK
ncbi:metal-sulfur cluster assembly factor [Methanobacterium aggregans]|uniref:metal-sulfur cluster assembly factor n=1 Tax=Methanobacterium aggregans TaxID=1615586 RepID=UPI001AEB5022|nr:iron-sulfur cluster assembly protein [Methanobacterium aggregans]MBP2045398.1 metal-sulfur cluster biosynthetic enzyme [Methanobacterium aggregans]